MGLPDEHVTLASQQARAHNLAWALHAAKPLREARIGVVGGGLAGLTFAVVAARLGAEVTLFEQAGRLLSTQWKSYDRYLHPRLFHWPEENWADGRVDHPALAWRDNFAAAVRDVILAQVPPDPSLHIRLGSFVTDVHPETRRVTIDSLEVDGHELRQVRHPHFDQAILATGFPTERPACGALGGSYWRTQLDASVLPGSCKAVRIVGNGDGALTELMSLSLPGFRQDRLRDFVWALEELRAGSKLRTGSTHGHITACLKAHHPTEAHHPIKWTLGRAVDDLSVVLTSKCHKLTEHSFLLNRCAAVAVEQAQLALGRPAIFCRPRATPYRASEISKDLAAERQVVWRIGPGSSQRLLLTFGLQQRCKLARPRSWVAQWGDDLAQARTTRQRTRRVDCRDVDLPDEPAWSASTVTHDGPPRVLPCATGEDREDVIPALDALATIAARHAGRVHILDTSAVRPIGSSVLLALDAIAAVASLPAALVLDTLLERGIAVYRFGPQLLLVGRGHDDIPREPVPTELEPRFRTLAAHIAVDAASVRAHLLSNSDRREIDVFLSTTST
jgi:hypothetical protein